MRMIALAFALLVCTAAHAYECTDATCPSECPIGSFYYTNGETDPSRLYEFCTFDFGYGVLPVGAYAACDHVADVPIGWVGFGYPVTGNAGYHCPYGLFPGPAPRAGDGLCISAVWPPQPGVFSYCEYLGRDAGGYIEGPGYGWRAQ